MNLRQTLLGMTALLGAASAHALVAPGSHYDNANDFSIAQNPNGVWSYGYSASTGGTFSQMAASVSVASVMQAWYRPGPDLAGSPVVYRNASTDVFSYGTITVAGLEAGFRPGADALAIYRFTAPTAGSYSVDAFFFSQDIAATGVDVFVLRNGATQLFSAAVAHAGADPYVAWSGTVTLAAGGTLDFAVDRAGDLSGDATGLGVQISAVPEPHTYAMLSVGLGLVALGLRRRRAKYARAALW